MRLPHFIRVFKEQTVQNKFKIIIGLMILILLSGLVNFWFGMRMMSGIRAYVAGEGLWSKAQKAAVINLGRYAVSGDEASYEAFLYNTTVQLGDRRARLEMDKPNPDMNVVSDGFIEGRNHPDDIRDLYFLYRYFKNVSYMKSAVQTWTEGDREMENLRIIGEQIHELISASPSDLPGAIGLAPDQRTEMYTLFTKLYDTDAKLTALEDHFSAILSEASRQINKTLLIVTIATTSLLGLLSVTVAIMIGKAVVRLDKQKSEFVSLASHQLRTPLTAIKWSAETLDDKNADNLTPMQRKYIAKLREGSKRMSALVGDLLRMSSLDLGTYQSKEKKIKIDNLLETIIDEQQQKITDRNITLTTRIEPDTPAIKSDEQLLTIIIQNLISNSIKYSRTDGKVVVNVSVKKGHLLIQVSDNGIGIPNEEQSQIFSKLFRAQNAVDHNVNEGTGLGLYITKAMVDRLGGKIWFDSVENIGSDFYVKIPL